MGRRQSRDEGTINYVAREIRDEAKYQLRGFPRELKYQVGRGWGEEFARQIFGPPKGRRSR